MTVEPGVIQPDQIQTSADALLFVPEDVRNQYGDKLLPFTIHPDDPTYSSVRLEKVPAYVDYYLEHGNYTVDDLQRRTKFNRKGNPPKKGAATCIIDTWDREGEPVTRYTIIDPSNESSTLRMWVKTPNSDARFNALKQTRKTYDLTVYQKIGHPVDTLVAETISQQEIDEYLATNSDTEVLGNHIDECTFSKSIEVSISTHGTVTEPFVITSANHFVPFELYQVLFAESGFAQMSIEDQEAWIHTTSRRLIAEAFILTRGGSEKYDDVQRRNNINTAREIQLVLGMPRDLFGALAKEQYPASTPQEIQEQMDRDHALVQAKRLLVLLGTLEQTFSDYFVFEESAQMPYKKKARKQFGRLVERYGLTLEQLEEIARPFDPFKLIGKEQSSIRPTPENIAEALRQTGIIPT